MSFESLIKIFESIVLVYLFSLNTIYLLLTVLATISFAKYLRRQSYSGHNDVFANPLTPGVSIIVPAFNEAAGIVENVRAMLSLRFPEFEVVVVDDGSTDNSFELLKESFSLLEIPWQPASNAIPVIGAIRSVHVAGDGLPLVVVRKENAGSRADATNAGINVARLPLFCMVDADSLLEPDALLTVVKPFVDDPERVVATGGVIRPANGCVVEQGHVVKTAMPNNWLARIQVVEYLRSFLLGRTGWSVLGGLLIISGAFGMFRRDIVMEVGGMDPNSIGEDAELVALIHSHLRSKGWRKYKIVFVAEPVCWTEVPQSAAVLSSQRRRWSRGLAEVLWKHRRMMFNPRYGRVGMMVMPYYLFFELLGPVIELLGFAVTAVGFATGTLNTTIVVAFAFAALGYGFFLSIAALAVEEFSFHRMNSWRDLAVSFVASIFENVGYRQLHAWWRLRGVVWWLTRGKSRWGTMPRRGFQAQVANKSR